MSAADNALWKNPASLFVRLTAAIVIAIALSTIWGWITQNDLLIHVQTTYPSMKFNTACCLLLSGISLLIGDLSFRRTALLSSLIAIVISLLTLLQYAFDVDLGIDRLLMAATPEQAASNTGRYGNFLLTLIGSVVIALGAVPLIGYFTAIKTAYTWGAFAGMAVHTSFSCVIMQCWAGRARQSKESTS